VLLFKDFELCLAAGLMVTMPDMQGNEVLEMIEKMADGRTPSAVFIRHAQRHPITDPSDPTLAELTEEGMAHARAFGARISGFRHLRLFHSPVKRCEQTAVCIAQGAAEKGLKVELCGREATLGVDYILDLNEAGRLTLLHGEHFVRLWFGGEIDRGIIRPARDIAIEKLEKITQRLADPMEQGARLDIHVSHDWNVLILREFMLGVRHEDTGWLTFLDGMGFSRRNGELAAVYGQTSSHRPLPWFA